MNNFIKIITLTTILAFSASASANSATDTFAQCLVDNLNGKERKSLAKWIFFAIGSHPEIKSYSNATEDAVDESNKYVGELISKLLLVNCPEELKSANKSDPLAIQKAFELVGQVAMQELMTNTDTMQALTNYTKYADLEKITKLLAE